MKLQLKVKDLYYSLPNELLARTPKELREDPTTRLLVMNRASGTVEHRYFDEVIEYFNTGDVLVLNNSKTIKADLLGWSDDGRRVNVHLACNMGEGRWKVYSFTDNLKVGTVITFGKNTLSCKLLSSSENGKIWVAQFSASDIFPFLDEVGRPIMSPYVKKGYDISYYRNHYATVEGSAELPAAGKHFSPTIIKKLENKGVQIVYITLHTGLSSIEVSEDDFEDHQMHEERIELTESAAKTINNAHAQGKRVFAVGTTAVRTLESCVNDCDVFAFSGYTNLYIYPGYKYRVCDALFTNFHGPRSSRIALAAAFTGKELLMKGYEEAIERKYAFYEFGDTTLTI